MWDMMPIEDVEKAKTLVSQRSGIAEEDFTLKIEWRQHHFKYETCDPPYCGDGGKEWDEWVVKAVIRSKRKIKKVVKAVEKMTHDLLLAIAGGV